MREKQFSLLGRRFNIHEYSGCYGVGRPQVLFFSLSFSGGVVGRRSSLTHMWVEFLFPGLSPLHLICINPLVHGI